MPHACLGGLPKFTTSKRPAARLVATIGGPPNRIPGGSVTMLWRRAVRVRLLKRHREGLRISEGRVHKGRRSSRLGPLHSSCEVSPTSIPAGERPVSKTEPASSHVRATSVAVPTGFLLERHHRGTTTVPITAVPITTVPITTSAGQPMEEDEDLDLRARLGFRSPPLEQRPAPDRPALPRRGAGSRLTTPRATTTTPASSSQPSLRLRRRRGRDAAPGLTPSNSAAWTLA
jgi:hypothetical protein